MTALHSIADERTHEKPKPLARRERQIMDVLYKLERATVGQVLAALPDQLNYSTVRAQLRVLEEKGHLRHEEQGLKYVIFLQSPATLHGAPAPCGNIF